MARFIVELLGPSGVGKTTTSEMLLKSPQNSQWRSLAKHLEQNHWSIAPPDFSDVEHLILEMRLANQLQARLFPVDLLYSSFIEYHHMSFEVENRRNPSENFYIADEHIFQLYVQEINYLITHAPEKLRPLVERRGFVFLTRPTEEIVRNIRLRRETGVYRSFANARNDDSLLKSVKWFIRQVPTLKKYFLDFGIPFIEVDLNAPKSLEKITVFLESLSQN